MKEVVGGVKNYIDEALTLQKEQTVRSNSSIISSTVQFKFKGNRVPFNFKTSQQEIIRKAIHIGKGDPASALKELKNVDDDIAKRNKLFRIANNSEDGWKVVDEYLSEELGSDSDDDKRIKAAQNRAANKHYERAVDWVKNHIDESLALQKEQTVRRIIQVSKLLKSSSNLEETVCHSISNFPKEDHQKSPLIT